jgi:putative endonuclease
MIRENLLHILNVKLCWQSVLEPGICEMSTIGELGEALVAEWLETKQARVLHYRWRVRRAEIDLIAEKVDGTLLFIEVKTRSVRNWDTDGLMTITTRKQEKILHGAEVFLGLHPELSDRACRFDVALVRRGGELIGQALRSTRLESGELLHLIQYLPGAFDGF